MPVPRILHIDILGLTISLELDMRGYTDVIPAAAVCVIFEKIVRRILHIFCISEFPDTIQRLFQALDILYKFGFAQIILVV